MELAPQIVKAIRSAITPEVAALHEPRFRGNERKYVLDCIDSTFVSSVGAYVTQFEKSLADYTGVRRAVAIVNGTAALQVALQLADVRPNDEVIVPTLTFVATGNAVCYLGAIPHFVDSEEVTLGISPPALRAWLSAVALVSDGTCRNRLTGRRIKAIVPMHCFGHPCQIKALLEIAGEFRLAMIEDAAESLGSWHNGQHTGTFGLLGTLSFNGNKIVTTGGGGAILTNDEKLADRAKHLTTTAKSPHRWEYFHDELGYNYRMPNLNAALGCAQLERLPEMLQSKRRLFERYKAAFSEVDHVRIMTEPEGARSNYWLQTLILDRSAATQRDAILATTNDTGLATRPAWTLLHRLPHFRDYPRAPLTTAESLSERIINLPSSAELV